MSVLPDDDAPRGAWTRRVSKTRPRPAPLRLLFICSANVDRSPTAQHLFNPRPGFLARSRGTWDSARRKLRQDDLDWADLVLVMEQEHLRFVEGRFPAWFRHNGKKIEVLDVKDEYGYLDPQLERLLDEKVERVLRRRDLIG